MQTRFPRSPAHFVARCLLASAIVTLEVARSPPSAINSEENAMNWTSSSPFQALALTGGGYRGLFTARALEILEAECGEPIGRRFDLLCGTSIGGIVAMAAAFEVPMSKVVRVFADRGPDIFPLHSKPSGLGKLRDLWNYRSKPRYLSSTLRSVVTEFIPARATLGDAAHPLCIPASQGGMAERLEALGRGGGIGYCSSTHVLRTRGSGK